MIIQVIIIFHTLQENSSIWRSEWAGPGGNLWSLDCSLTNNNGETDQPPSPHQHKKKKRRKTMTGVDPDGLMFLTN